VSAAGSGSEDLFSGIADPPYVSGVGFSPDGERMVDVLRLQASLLSFFATNGDYPHSLVELFPEFAPLGDDGEPLVAPPTDPVTSAPYDYDVSADGSSYRLTASLSNGRTFDGFQSPSR
jgi:hypothetical protein